MSKTKDRFKIIIPKGYTRKKLPYFKEWVTALDSGRFHQVTSTLCQPIGKKKVGYCCLGVLCRVQGRLVKDREQGLWYDQADIIKDTVYIGEQRSYGNLYQDNPSYEALSYNGKFPKGVKLIMNNGTEIFSLIDCNDDGKLNFKEIAKVIRRIWKA